MVTRQVDVAEVWLWGRQIGAVLWNDSAELATFEYTSEFQQSGIEVAPLTMPLGGMQYQFPELDRRTFQGLPGMLADSLPDRWGNQLIDAWLAETGRSRATFSPVERLCYIGVRGMGALEYRPALRVYLDTVPVEVDQLADLAARVLADREQVQVELADQGLEQLLRVGTSAGGARAKALIAWNRDTGEIRSGQTEAPDGFQYWILKFDGVGSSDRDLRDPKGYGRVEHAYHQMAGDAGLIVPEAHLHVDGAGRAHFMTRRFDRTSEGGKLHTQTLTAMAHYDFNRPGEYSYESALTVLGEISAPQSDVAQQFRRMVFNIVARNQDDHPKNISYAMDKQGSWRLSPAYDVMWAYNPSGEWTNRHQMTVAGKRDGFTRGDLERVGRRFGIRAPGQIVDEVTEVVSQWRKYAAGSDVPEDLVVAVEGTLRLELEKDGSVAP